MAMNILNNLRSFNVSSSNFKNFPLERIEIPASSDVFPGHPALKQRRKSEINWNLQIFR